MFSCFFLPVKNWPVGRGARGGRPPRRPPRPPRPEGRAAPPPPRGGPSGLPAGSARARSRPLSRHRPCRRRSGRLPVPCPRGLPLRPGRSRPVPGRRPSRASQEPARSPRSGKRRPAAPGSVPAPRRPSRLAGRARAGAPSCPSPGVLPPPMRSRRGCRAAAPSAVSRHPAVSPSYAGRRSEPPRHQQLFLDFFQEFFGRYLRPTFPQLERLETPAGEGRAAINRRSPRRAAVWRGCGAEMNESPGGG